VFKGEPLSRAQATDIFRNDAVLPSEALGLNLTIQLSRIVAASIPALEQVRFKRIEQGGVELTPGVALWKG
jgi:hypothetical protein